jgi:hypothetical protein
MFSTEIQSIIREHELQTQPSDAGDALGASVVDALLCGTRVVAREPPRGPTPLARALVEAMHNSTTWRE